MELERKRQGGNIQISTTMNSVQSRLFIGKACHSLVKHANDDH